MPNFPLFCMDPTSLIRVFDNFETIQIFNISLCSQKSFKLAQLALRKTSEVTSIYIVLTESPCIHIHLQGEESVESTFINCKNLQDSVNCPTRLSEGSIRNVPYLWTSFDSTVSIFWEDQHLGMKILFEHFIKLYEKPKYFLIPDLGYKGLLEVLDLMNLYQIEIRLAELHGGQAPFTRVPLSEVLDRLKNVENIYFNDITPDEAFISDYQLNFESIAMNSGAWVTLPWLLSLKSTISIEISESSITSLELNLYIKEWIKGALPNLEDLRLGINGADFEVILEGISLEGVRNIGRRIRYDFKRCDGAMAAVVDTGTTMVIFEASPY